MCAVLMWRGAKPAIRKTRRAIKLECDRLQSFQFDTVRREGRGERVAGQHNRVDPKVTLREMTLIRGLIGSLGLIFSPLLLMDLFIVTLP